MQLNRFDLNLLIALDALLMRRTSQGGRAGLRLPAAMSAALQKLREYFTTSSWSGSDGTWSSRPAAYRSSSRSGRPCWHSGDAGHAAELRPGHRSPHLHTHRIRGCRAAGHACVFKRLAKEAPRITCHVEHFSETTLSRLEYGDADLYLGLNSLRLFGLRAFPDTLRMFDLRPVQWVAVVAQDHPSVENTITEAQYLALPMSRLAERHTLPLEKWSAPHQRRHRCQGNDAGAVGDSFLLRGTELIATLPEHLARVLAKLAPVKVLPLPFTTPETREVVIGTREMTDPVTRGCARSLSEWRRSLAARPQASPTPRARSRSPAAASAPVARGNVIAMHRLENPHCGDNANCSSGAYCAASSMRRLIDLCLPTSRAWS